MKIAAVFVLIWITTEVNGLRCYECPAQKEGNDCTKIITCDPRLNACTTATFALRSSVAKSCSHMDMCSSKPILDPYIKDLVRNTKIAYDNLHGTISCCQGDLCNQNAVTKSGTSEVKTSLLAISLTALIGFLLNHLFWWIFMHIYLPTWWFITAVKTLWCQSRCHSTTFFWILKDTFLKLIL